MPAAVHASMNPSASSVMNAAKTVFVGCALIAATSFGQSPLRAPHIARPVNVPPPLANPSLNAPAVSVPKASSAYTAKTLFSPLFAAHSPSGSPSCHDVAVARNTKRLLQLGLQPV